LYALREVARSLGLEPRLAEPLDTIDRDPSLSLPARTALLEAEVLYKVDTVGAFLAGANPAAPRWRASRAVREELLDAVVRWLVAEPAEAPPAAAAPEDEPAEAPPVPAPPWGHAGALRAWAEARGLEPILGYPVSSLASLFDGPAAEKLRRVEPHAGTVSDVVSESSWARPRLELKLGGRFFDEVEAKVRGYLRGLAGAAPAPRSIERRIGQERRPRCSSAARSTISGSSRSCGRSWNSPHRRSRVRPTKA
jgi:hypothetical protein